MLRSALAATCAALLAFASQGPVMAERGASLPESVDWSISPSGEEDEGQVQLTLSYRSRGGHSVWSNNSDLAELAGLLPAQLGSREGVPVRFRIVREAGRFDCEGTVRRERGTGHCRFEGDEAYAAALDARGIGRPTPAQQFSLALARVGLDLVDSLDRHGFARPTVDLLVRAGIHGVSPSFVDAMREAGYPAGGVDGLVDMRIHGVTPEFVRALAQAGYGPEPENLRRLAIHGVSTDFIREMGELGYSGISADDLVDFRIHGVSPAFVRQMQQLGYDRLSPNQLRSMRIHGVTADFVRAQLRDEERPSAEELISRRIRGG